MTWETPELVEIDMSAEIGGYQGDDFGPDAGGERVAQLPAQPPQD